MKNSIPLDLQRITYISEIRNCSTGQLEKYSIDFEKANDSHYEISIEDMLELTQHLKVIFHKDDMISCLKEFFAKKNELDFISLLSKQKIK